MEEGGRKEGRGILMYLCTGDAKEAQAGRRAGGGGREGGRVKGIEGERVKERVKARVKAT